MPQEGFVGFRTIICLFVILAVSGIGSGFSPFSAAPAYAAEKKHSAELGRMAWEKLIGPAGKLPPLNQPQRVTGPNLLKPVTDPSFLGAPVGWQLHGVASVQWALNAIETLEFAKPWLADWEKAQTATGESLKQK